MFNGRNAEELPSHIVLFDSMEKRVSMFLQSENYLLVGLTTLLAILVLFDNSCLYWYTGDRLTAVHAIYRLVGVTLMQDKRIFHAHFPVDRELQGHVLVYTRSAKTSKLS
jgi:hypothetical protein